MPITNPDWVPPIEMDFDVGKPIRSEQGLLLAGNPIAIAEGAPGAPRVDLPAIVDALASVPAGSLGSYVWATKTTSGDVSYGSTVAGSKLRPTSAVYEVQSSIVTGGFISGLALSGTWRCMGEFDSQDLGNQGGLLYGSTLWLRIA